MYLSESPFFKTSLAGAIGLVLMSVPVECLNAPSLNMFEVGTGNTHTERYAPTPDLKALIVISQVKLDSW